MESFALMSSSQRILEWRTFRKSLVDKTELEQLEAVAQYWSKAPLQTFSIDWDKPDTWPTAWEILYECDFDSNSVAYMIEQTLILSGWDASRIRLCYINDIKLQVQMMVVIVDNKYILNYSLGEVFDLDRIKGNCIFFIKYQFINNKHVEV